MKQMQGPAWRIPGLGGDWSSGSSGEGPWVCSYEPNEWVEHLLPVLPHWQKWARELAEPLGRWIGVPPAEVVRSPFGFRAVILGVQSGVGAIHDEVRTPTVWPMHMTPEDPSVAPTGERWKHGKLHVEKYTSFCQDAPFIHWIPEHSDQWTPHEMLHRALGFLYRPDLTRFELYLGSRLNESLPVALWYGWDRFLADPEKTGAGEMPAWLDWSPKELKQHILKDAHWLNAGWEWALGEFEAVEQELHSGRIFRRPGGPLDGSSDAMAYVVAHWDRLQSSALQGVLMDVPIPSVERYETVPAYQVAWRELVKALWNDDLTGGFEQATQHRERRMQWDRLQLHIHCGGRSTEEEQEWGPPVGGYGWMRSHEEHVAWGHLVEGIESVLPATVHALSEGDPEAQVLAHFVQSEIFLQRKPLSVRMGEAIQVFDAPFIRELLHLETLLESGLGRDDGVERLSHGFEDLPDRWMEGVVSVNPEFRMEGIPEEVLNFYLEVTSGEGTLDLGAPVCLMGKLGGDVVILPAPPPIAAIWVFLQKRTQTCRAVQEKLEPMLKDMVGYPGWPADAQGWLRMLIGAGALFWSPQWNGLTVDEDGWVG